MHSGFRFDYKKLPKQNFALFVFPTFFILLADSIMSYVFPVITEGKLGSNSQLGFVMAFSSLVGISFDLFFAHHVPSGGWRKLFRVGIILSMLFPLITVLASGPAQTLILLFASAIWGIYYEFIAFGIQDYVATTQPREELTWDWSIVHALWQLGSLIGPIIGALALERGGAAILAVVLFLQATALGLSLLFRSDRPAPRKVHPKRLLESLKHLTKIGAAILPLLLTTFSFQMINSAYWTIGGLFGERLGELEWLVLTLYSAGLITGNFLLSRWPIVNGKKNFAISSLLSAGLLMAALLFVNPSPIVYAVIFGSSLFLAFVNPLNEAVYSDLAKKVPDFEVELISLSRIAVSAAFILGPLLWGVCSDLIGYKMTFGLAGLSIGAIGFVLLLFTPLKLSSRLPKA